MSNFILLHFGLPELIIRREERQEYIGALKQIRIETTDEYLVSFFFETAIKYMKSEIGQKGKAGVPVFFF